ncbi:MAG: hypothetical protein AAF550_13420, partial [Myxococcota bacterium]
AFQSWGGSKPPGFAGLGDSYRPPEQERSTIEKSLGVSVADNLRSEDPPVEPTGIEIRAEEYQGIEVTVEDPEFRGLTPFFEQLVRTAKKEAGAITRIAHLGDSSIATDLITHTVRRNLQLRFGDAGHGFVLVARGALPYGHRDVHHTSSNHWTTLEAVRKQARDGHYGIGGVQVRARAGAWAIFGTAEHPRSPVGQRMSIFELHFQRHPRGPRIRIELDDREVRWVETRSEEPEDGHVRIQLEDGPHRVQVRPGPGGIARLYGAVLEREVPGVVYDSLGMVGARARRLSNFDEKHIQHQLSQRQTNLLIVGFGGNSASDPLERSEYKDNYRRMLRRVRGTLPAMGCLIFAPLDQGYRRAGRIQTLEALPLILESQRSVAFEEGCAFFNTFEAMGGAGAIGRWYRAKPRLALGDLRHATPEGYSVIGNMFSKALLKSFAHWLERPALESTSPKRPPVRTPLDRSTPSDRSSGEQDLR